MRNSNQSQTFHPNNRFGTPSTRPRFPFIRLQPLPLLTLGVFLMLIACATKTAPLALVPENKPPARPFSQFTRFELLPIQTTTHALDTDEALLSELAIQFQEQISPIIQEWNERPRTKRFAETLLITPTVSVRTSPSDNGQKHTLRTTKHNTKPIYVIDLEFLAKELNTPIASASFAQTSESSDSILSDIKLSERLAGEVADYLNGNFE